MNNGAKETVEQTQALGRMWMEFMSRLVGAGLTCPSDVPPPKAVRQIRDAMLAAAGNYCDSFMRSESFLGAMKESMGNMIDIREQFNDLAVRLHHEVGAVAREDLDAAMAAIERIETRLFAQMDRLEARLGEIEKRLATTGGPDDASACK